MRKLVVLTTVLLFLVACTETPDQKAKKFKQYKQSVGELKLPAKHNSTILFAEIPETTDGDLYKRFGLAHAYKPAGVVHTSDSISIIMDLMVSEAGHAPNLVSYDAFGNKIDSISLYQKSGWDIGYQAIEYLFVESGNMIYVIDSVSTFELNAHGTDELPNTKKTTVDTTYYGFSPTGEFTVKTKDNVIL